jgi:predicted PurR-regulated permease PerM
VRIDVTSSEERLQARNDLAWAIAVGGFGIVLFAALLMVAWYFAATLFLIFTGVLLGAALTAMTDGLGRLIRLPHPVRLGIVCIALAALLVGVIVLESFLDKNGIDTSYFNLASATAQPGDSNTAAQGTPAPHNLPSASELASSGGAIVSQTLKLLLGTVSAVGNVFIALFLGLAFAAQPSVYRSGLLLLAPAKQRDRVTVIFDRISETLERWLIAQILTMFVVFAVTWIGLAIIGIPSSFILGIQSGLLAFIPTVGALVAGLIVVLASLGSGWVATLSAFALFLGVHALESFLLTPIIQRQALDIPPATLFAFQIFFGVVFGIWGLALALPLIAIIKVIIDYFKSDELASRPA